ncbi:MAG: Eco47II family restriction endonuclease [Clostridia bacterium]|nr:Eco47II family restriction endonuclease [Clostridia bacterium]
MWNLEFISEQDFKRHVQNTIQHYGEKLLPYDLKKFNSNIVDPIKLIFDKNVYRYSWEDIIKNEIYRQRDKSSNNDIGYFHQRIFQYMRGCDVPNTGWDVIFSPEGGVDVPECGNVKTIYVEMKNKHNTMNSASSAKTYMKMQGQLLADDDCACFLVEAIAKKSQNTAWAVSVDGTKQKHRRIRRVSMDEFYYTVTGQREAFYNMCMVLPSVIGEVVSNADGINIPNDTAFEELQLIADAKNGSFALALYMLGFESYIGF